MGGIGSGRQWMQTTLDDTYNISISWLKRNNDLQPGYVGKITWSRNGHKTGSVNYKISADALILNFKHRTDQWSEYESVEQHVKFQTTPCHYGGYRKWFTCPHCNRRVGVLYGYGKLFLCRHCYALPYKSTLQSPLDRIIDKKHKLGERIFEYYEYGEGFGKKKGMHWKKFRQSHLKYKTLEKCIDGEINTRFHHFKHLM